MKTSPDDLITTAEAAELLGVAIPTLHRWCEIGKLETAQKLPGIRGARLFRRSAIDALSPDSPSAA